MHFIERTSAACTAHDVSHDAMRRPARSSAHLHFRITHLPFMVQHAFVSSQSPARSESASRRRAPRALSTIALVCATALFATACGERAEPQRGGATPVLTASFKPKSGFVVPVAIAGKTYRFLVDTGASHTVIDNRLAQSITQPSTDEQIPIAYRSMLAKGLTTADGVLPRERVRLW